MYSCYDMFKSDKTSFYVSKQYIAQLENFKVTLFILIYILEFKVSLNEKFRKSYFIAIKVEIILVKVILTFELVL